MENTGFVYSEIRNLIQEVSCKLRTAGYKDEAEAFISLTHIVGHRVEEVNLPNADWALTHLTDYLDNCNHLNSYINENHESVKVNIRS